MTGVEGQTELANQSFNKWITSPVYDVEEYLESLSMGLFLNLLPTVVFIGVQAAVGVPGNLLIICVYLKQFRSSSTKVFIVAMAVCDLLTNVVSSPLLILHLRKIYNNVDDVGCKVMEVSWRFPSITSLCLLVCVAFDRRRRICCPLRRQMTARHALYALLIPLSLTVLLTLPFMVMHGQVRYGVTRECDIKPQYIQEDKDFAIVLMVFFGMILACLGGCYVHIACKACQLKRSWPNQQYHNYHPGEKSNITSTDCTEQTEPNEVEISVSAPDHKTINTINQVTAIDQFSPNAYLEKHDFEASFRSTSDELPRLKKISAETAFCPTASKPNESSKSNNIISSPKNSAGSIDELYRMQPDETKQTFEEGEKNEGETNRSVKAQGKHQKNYFSKTTLMMFVLTITTIVFFVPHIILQIMGDGCFGHEGNLLKMNSCHIALVFPYLSSVINPFIYSFCNPKFRLHCRRFLLSLYRRVSYYQ